LQIEVLLLHKTTCNVNIGLERVEQIMIKLTRIVTLCLLLLLTTTALAENPDQNTELPIGFTDEELLRLDEIGINHIATSPPPSGVIRNCAEWDPSQGVIVRYPFGISYSIIAEMSEDLIVYTIVGSASQQSTVTTNYTNNGVNMANVEFIIAPSDSYWTRDYGPWFIFDGNGDFGLVDPVYNRPRPNDDAIPVAVGSYLSCPVYGMPLITPGGNYMSDGLGIGFSTTLVASENPSLTQAEIDSLILTYMGNDFFTYPDPLNEYIEHIDCWGKFLSPHTVLILEVPSSHSQYDELNAAADSIGQLYNSWGQQYNVVRVLSTGSQAYTNSIILNDKVFVPISSSYPYDSLALESYRDAMPGYEVIGFTGNWYNTDALHCRAMGVPDSNMLFLHHIPLFVSNDTINDYEIEVEITDHSAAGLITDSLKIYYSIDGGAWTYSMLTAGAGPNMYDGTIPAQTFGTEIRYYVRAADNSGRVEHHPIIGEPGAHTLNILNIVPEIDLSETLFTFDAIEGEKAILYDTLTITNAGSGSLDWDAVNDSTWLSLDPTSGYAPSNVELEVNTSGLTVGTYIDTITVSATGAVNTPQKVIVQLTINEPPPAINLSEAFFEFEVYEGVGITLFDTLFITNGGGGTLNWSVINVESWLQISPLSGTAPGEVQVSASTYGLLTGMHYDTITVSAAGASNDPQKVPVSLYIIPEDIPTVISTTPVADETGVSINTDITFTFSTAMDPTTMIPLNFFVGTPGDVFWDGVVTYDSATMTTTFNVIGELWKGQLIIAEVTTNVRTLGGTPLEEAFFFEFTTESNTAPDAPSDPGPTHQATEVPLDANLSWSCNDPDGDDLTFLLCFGTDNPPPYRASGLTDPSYALPPLNNATEYFWYVIAFDDYSGSTQSQTFSFTTELGYICGDATSDEIVNVSDAVWIINYVFVGGDAPYPYESGDVNCDDTVNVSDAVSIINYVFVGGYSPCDIDGDEEPDC
jgi:agmatine deiminase